MPVNIYSVDVMLSWYPNTITQYGKFPSLAIRILTHGLQSSAGGVCTGVVPSVSTALFPLQHVRHFLIIQVYFIVLRAHTRPPQLP